MLFQKNLAIGTENGKVFIYNAEKKEVTKCVKAEPWVSSLENCRGVIWTSGISRSLMCIRVKDNKKVFHTNTNTEFYAYDSKIFSNIRDKGVQILQEKIVRYFFYNSSNSQMRIMNSWHRKKILKFNLILGFENENELEKLRIGDFKVDDQRNHIMFTYDRKPELYIYSYTQRKIIQIIKNYNIECRSNY